MRYSRVGLLLSCLVGVWTPLLAAEDPEALWKAVQLSTLDAEAAVAVHNLELDMGLARLRLLDGVLIPAQPIAGSPREMVFVGSGRFELEPPTRVERHQLRLFTDLDALDVGVTEVVLAVGSSSTTGNLLDREAAAPGEEQTAKARAAFEAWVAGPERRGFGAEGAVYAAALGDQGSDGYFAARCESGAVGSFYYAFDETSQEQITLGQFVPIEADVKEERRIRKEIRREKREGRLSRLEFEDLGSFDSWVASPLIDDEGQPQPGGLGFESAHYRVDVTLDPEDETISGTATIRVRAEAAGRRVIPFSIDDELDVTGATDENGTTLPSVQSGGDVFVVIDQAPEVGQEREVTLAFSGPALAEYDPGTYVLRNTFAWYPRIGDVDRATYDVTLRWPRKYQLLASGKSVEAGQEGSLRWDRRRMDRPGFAFSFEVGKFEILEEQVGHVALRVGFGKAKGEYDRNGRKEVLETLKSSLLFFEEKFGPYPLDYLTVATVPRGFSQGFPGFVTLTQLLFWQPVGYGWLIVPEDYQRIRQTSRSETVAHELAHQWWGNKVGWASYRDQWLSEALADYSAMVYMAHKANRKSLYLARHAQEWKDSLTDGAGKGKSVASLGPVVVGHRLNSSLSSGAYKAIVYDKGSVVFSMLARIIGEEAMSGMLQSLATAVDNRVITTESFVKALERMGGFDLSTFADQFIYGTGLPEIYYSYDFTKNPDGTWGIDLETRQIGTPAYRYALVRTDAETWHVRRERVSKGAVRTAAILVPWQASLAEAEGLVETRRGVSRSLEATQRGFGGRIVIHQDVQQFHFDLPKKPKTLWLDQRGEVLAFFYSEAREPKRTLRYQGYDLTSTGEFDRAEAAFRKALAAPLVDETMLVEKVGERELKRRAKRQDAAIHLGLATMYLEREDDANARASLEAAEELLSGLDSSYYWATRTRIQSHLDVRAGEYARAYDGLSKSLYLDVPVIENETIGRASRRRKFASGRRFWGNGRIYALFAVAALETGHDEIGELALVEAEDRGADVSEYRADLERGR